jgi:hypothetical protein
MSQLSVHMFGLLLGVSSLNYLTKSLTDTETVATLVPRLFDELGPLWNRKPLREQYRDVIRGDRDMRHFVDEIPSFLLREDTTEQVLKKPWLDIARRSLAITAAEKVSYRPFSSTTSLTNTNRSY